MKAELDNALCKDFPKLYRERYLDPKTTCMCWGFSCGDGWEPIIRELSKQLEEINNRGWADVAAVQVKEKFGGLRFYVELRGDEIDNLVQDCVHALINQAERQADMRCEVCGEYGVRRSGGWIKTLCDKHAEDGE